MAATVEIDEANGAGETLTHGISNCHMGSVDSADMDADDNPIVPGDNTYEKWQKFHVTAMGGSTKINNLKVWRTGSLAAEAVHVTNARESSYGGAETYAQPVATDSAVAAQTMPASEPTGANLGIGGALAGELTATGSSDYLIHQIQSTVSAVAGATATQNFQYDEVA